MSEIPKMKKREKKLFTRLAKIISAYEEKHDEVLGAYISRHEQVDSNEVHQWNGNSFPEDWVQRIKIY